MEEKTLTRSEYPMCGCRNAVALESRELIVPPARAYDPSPSHTPA